MSTINRKDIRLPLLSYVGMVGCFVTVCTFKRRSVFVDGAACSIVTDALRRVANEMRFLVHAYCIMPDHVHFLVEGDSPDCNLLKFVTRWKQFTGFSFRKSIDSDFWQRGFYDHVLRSSRDVDPIAWYIWMNPVRAGIVRQPGEYEFSGSFTMPWPIIPPRVDVGAWVPPWKSNGGSGNIVRERRVGGESLNRGRAP